MRRSITSIAAIIALIGGARAAGAQQATERFIPVGQSPGVSGIYSYIGEVEAVDAENRTITVRGPQGSRTISVPEGCPVWLDRSEAKLINLTGGFGDISVGRRIEVMYTDYGTKDAAAWVKLVG